MDFEMPRQGAEKGRDLHGQRVLRGDYQELSAEGESKAAVVEDEIAKYEQIKGIPEEIERLTRILGEKEAALAVAKSSEEQLKIEKEIWGLEDAIKFAKEKLDRFTRK